MSSNAQTPSPASPDDTSALSDGAVRASEDVAPTGGSDGAVRPEPEAPEVEVEQVIDPATVRRAPRYKAFFWTGAVVGLLGGSIIAALLLSTPAAGGLMKPGVYFSVTVLATTTVTVLLAALLAVIADRRSMRRR